MQIGRLLPGRSFRELLSRQKSHGEHWATGLGNGYTTFFLSPEHGEGLYWGGGPVLYYPSATDSALDVHRWGSGPSVAVVRRDGGPWVMGAVVNNIWSFGGNSNNANRTDTFLLNPFVSYHFADGWSAGSSPNITADWIAKGANGLSQSAAAWPSCSALASSP